MSTLTHSVKNHVIIVLLEKQLGLDSTFEVREYLNPLLEAEELQGMIMNCRKLDYITSSGIGLIADYFKRLLQRQLPFALVEVNKKVEEVFKLTGFDRHIAMLPTEEAALEKFKTVDGL